MPSGMPDDAHAPDKLRPPDEEVAYLLERHKLRRGKRTLALYRRVGGGPPFVRIGNDVLYPERLTDRWVRERLSEPVSSSSELRARRQMLARMREADQRAGLARLE
jgi:hypothetical protein